MNSKRGNHKNLERKYTELFVEIIILGSWGHEPKPRVANPSSLQLHNENIKNRT